MSIRKLFIESLDEFVEDNSITLYHYSKENQEKLTVKPSEFGRSAWSRTERKASTYPRSFFYVDLADTERHFSGKTLYKTIVDKDAIYDLKADPRGIVKEVKSDSGALDIDKLLKTVHERGFMGIFYESRMSIVSLFEPITAKRVQESGGNFVRSLKQNRVEEILNSKNVVIISAYRSENSGEQNNKADLRLFNDLMQSEFKFAEAEGGFIENQGKEDETEVVEKSYIMWADDVQVETLREFAISLAKKYKQEAVLWKQADDPMGYFLYPSGNTEKIGAYVPNQKDTHFTRVGDFHFVFR